MLQHQLRCNTYHWITGAGYDNNGFIVSIVHTTMGVTPKISPSSPPTWLPYLFWIIPPVPTDPTQITPYLFAPGFLMPTTPPSYAFYQCWMRFDS
ncbi:unnamed protein product [Dicrocoelium dendriticum]|nr:unnamed protein product [Dicrocoelium dendriticum]